MLFSSIPFLFYFLPCVLLVYFHRAAKGEKRRSARRQPLFYGWGEPRFLLFMVFSIVQGYVFARLIERCREKRKKLFLTLSLVLSFAPARRTASTRISLSQTSTPLTGLSLPLLAARAADRHQLLYVPDPELHRSTCTAAMSRRSRILSILPPMSPCSRSSSPGPIVRYADIAPAAGSTRTHTLGDAAAGAAALRARAGEKGPACQSCSASWCPAFRASAEQSVLYYWLYADCLHPADLLRFLRLQRYGHRPWPDLRLPFPGELPTIPYISGSITEFWRRWHISLGSVVPGLSLYPAGRQPKVSAPAWLLNILIVWMLTGLWHGAAWNFVLWGLLYAVLLMAEKLFVCCAGWKKLRVLKHVYVLLSVTLGFVLFDAASLQDALQSDRRHVRRRDGLPLGDGEPVLRSAATPSCSLHRRARRNAAAAAMLCASGAETQRCGSAGARRCWSRSALLRCWRSVRRFWWTGRSIRSCISGFEEVRHEEKRNNLHASACSGLFPAGFLLWSAPEAGRTRSSQRSGESWRRSRS